MKSQSVFMASLPCTVLIALLPFISGCIMDGPFVDQDIDKLVSQDSAVGWAPKGSPAPVTPLAIPIAQGQNSQGKTEAARRAAEDSVVGAPLLVNDPTKKLSLTDCLDQALSNSPVTRGVWESARATAATVGIADAAYMPQIAFTGAMGPQRIAEAPLVVTQTAGTAAIGMNWVLMDFGRRDADSARARAQLIAANYTFNRAMQKLVFDVQSAYFTLDAKISLREAARENVATARKQLDATDDRMTVGLATRPEVLQARQQYLQTLYDLENAKAEVFTAQATLAVTMGIPADRAPNIVTLSELPLPDSLTKGVACAVKTSAFAFSKS